MLNEGEGAGEEKAGGGMWERKSCFAKSEHDSSWPQNSRAEYSKNFVTYVFLSSVHFP